MHDILVFLQLVSFNTAKGGDKGRPYNNIDTFSLCMQYRRSTTTKTNGLMEKSLCSEVISECCFIYHNFLWKKSKDFSKLNILSTHLFTDFSLIVYINV